MKRLFKRGLVLGALLLIGALATGLWYHLLRREPAPHFASEAENFKYGSINTAPGFPLYIWEAMLDGMADQLPPGGLGLIQEPGRSTPVGFALRTVGFPGLNANCALCHCGTVQSADGSGQQVYPGAPAQQFDFRAFESFAMKCAEDPRFTAATLMPLIRRRHSLGWFEGWVYRWLLIPATRKKVLEQRDASAWVDRRPPAGPGRTDAFSRLKINFLGLPDDGTTDTSDSVPLWHQQARTGRRLHWNGAGTRVDQDNFLSAVTLIGKPGNLDAATFNRMTNFLWNVKAPAFPSPVKAPLAAQGERVYRQHCAECHAPDGAKTGQVTPQSEVGTDPDFLRMWTPAFQAALKAYRQPPFNFDGMVPSDGYVNPLLDGCWLRAPYLHNGSVPTLADLLQPPAERPTVFFRGGTVYGPDRMGFVSTGPGGFRYDTSVPGNGNRGHIYGTALPATEKTALLEYLKTL